MATIIISLTGKLTNKKNPYHYNSNSRCANLLLVGIYLLN